VEDYGKAISLNPGDPSAFYNRAMSRLELGDRTQAAADMRTAARMGYGPAQQWLNDN
jgi:Flp pilus assembly protein TadD